MTTTVTLHLFSVLLMLTSFSAPVNGCSEMSGWSGWGSCSNSCGGGTRSRSRQCCSFWNIFGWCIGTVTNESSSESCNTQCCAVHGGWSAFNSWSSCPVTCDGKTNNQYRTRSCNNPTPLCGGSTCSGSSYQYQTCNAQCCPVDGGWSAYGPWSICPVTCGGSANNQFRTRTCNDPSMYCGGADCSGFSTEYATCNTNPCPDTNWLFAETTDINIE